LRRGLPMAAKVRMSKRPNAHELMRSDHFAAKVKPGNLRPRPIRPNGVLARR